MDFFIITIIRLVVPLIIFRFPLLGIFLVAYIDGEDWHWLNLSGQEEIEFYRIWDKLLDVYYLGIAFLTSISWTDKIARLISFYSYTLRILGVLIFIVLRVEYLFHVKGISPINELANLGELLGYGEMISSSISLIVILMICLVLPLFTLFWLLKRKKIK